MAERWPAPSAPQPPPASWAAQAIPPAEPEEVDALLRDFSREEPERWTRDSLRKELSRRGLSAAGLKHELLARLKNDDARARGAQQELRREAEVEAPRVRQQRQELEATQKQISQMSTLAQRFGEVLPATWMGVGAGAMTRSTASLWIDAVYRKHPEARPEPHRRFPEGARSG